MFSVRTPNGTMRIILFDMIICLSVFLVSEAMFREYYSAKQTVVESIAIYWGFTGIIIISLFLAHLYTFVEYIYPMDLLKRITPAFIFSFCAISTVGFFTHCINRAQWGFVPSLIVIYMLVYGFRFYVFFGRPENRERILILGANTNAARIIRESKKRFRGYDIIGLSTTKKVMLGKVIENVPVLCHSEDLETTAMAHKIDTILIAKRDRRGTMPINELLKIKMRNVRVQEGYTFYEKIHRKIPIDDYLKPSWFIFEEGFFQTSFHRYIKRVQGIIVSFILLTLLSPILALVAFLIKLESPGPVFFKQERVGLNRKNFLLIKFRSMRQDAEKHGAVFAQKNDPRVTRVGRVIRKIRLDEVPQFINIFKGDMDLVGPRPERPVFVEQLEQEVPYYNLRHFVRPGLTGWAQVNYPYGDSFKDSKEKLKYDLYYVKHCSWYLDLLIILMTIREVVFSKGR